MPAGRACCGRRQTWFAPLTRIVGRLDSHLDVVWMGFLQTCGGNPDERTSLLQLENGRGSGVEHGLARAPRAGHWEMVEGPVWNMAWRGPPMSWYATAASGPRYGTWPSMPSAISIES